MLIRLTTCQKKSCRLLSDVLDTLHCWKAGAGLFLDGFSIFVSEFFMTFEE